MASFPPSPVLPSAQRGVISILTASVLVVLILLLALVTDTGRLYLEKRNLQRIVDMAALDASARLPQGYCAGGFHNGVNFANAFALQSAEMNGFNDSAGSITTSCVTVGTNADGLRTITPNPNQGGAIQVTANKTVPASLIIRGGALFSSEIFDDQITISATSTAQRSQRGAPTAAFSVSTRLLSLDNEALLGTLLSNVGLNAQDLELLGPRGVLNTTITPSGLLEALGIEVSVDELGLLTPQSILNTSGISVKDIIDASAELIGNNTLSARVSAISNKLIDASLDTVDLFGENGLIHVESGSQQNTRAALETGLDLGELLGLTLIAGNSEKSLEIPELNILGISIVAGITSPPALAVGPVGTQAYTGQARLHIEIDTHKIVGVGLLTQLLGTRIHLPITLELAKAEATLEAIDCSVEPPTVDISVSSSLLEICVGDVSNSDGESIWETSQSCTIAAKEMDLITLLGSTIARGKLIIRNSSDASKINYFEDITAGDLRSYIQSNPLELGSIITSIVSNLVNLLNQTNNNDNTDLTKQIATNYLEASKEPSGRYNPASAANLVLNGNNNLPKLATSSWTVTNYKCVGLLVLCTLSSAPFSEAFVDMSNSGGLLGLGLLPNTRNGYQACAGLLSSLTNFKNYNDCVRDNLALILRNKPGGLDLVTPGEGTGSPSPAICQTFLCNLIRIPLNSVSKVLTDLLLKDIGLELGRTDVYVESINCGVPTLVQ